MYHQSWANLPEPSFSWDSQETCCWKSALLYNTTIVQMSDSRFFQDFYFSTKWMHLRCHNRLQPFSTRPQDNPSPEVRIVAATGLKCNSLDTLHYTVENCTITKNAIHQTLDTLHCTAENCKITRMQGSKRSLTLLPTVQWGLQYWMVSSLVQRRLKYQISAAQTAVKSRLQYRGDCSTEQYSSVQYQAIWPPGGHWSPDDIPKFTISLWVGRCDCTVLGWGELNCTARRHSGLHFSAVQCTIVQCSAVHCSSLHCTALHWVQCSAVHCSSLHCTVLHYTALCSAALHHI